MLNALALIFLGPVILICFAGIWVLGTLNVALMRLWARITK